MTTRYPTAVVLSATTHFAIIALILLVTYIAQKNLKDPPRFIELVAGPGDNYEAKVAPALGSPTGIDVPAQLPVATPPATPRATPPPAPVVPVTRAAPTPAIQNTPPPKQLTEAEFKKLNAGKKQPVAPKAQAVKAPKVDAVGIARGVIGGSTANKIGGAGGKALTREEASQMDLYFSLFRTMLRESITRQPGLSDTLTARLSVVIAADGVLTNARITRTSGNADFDRAILKAVQAIGKMKSRPDRTTEAVEVDINLRDLSAP